jgi:hypothetical protein
MIDQSRSLLGPLGGFTSAGLRAIGMQDLESVEGLETWPSGPTDEDMAYWYAGMLVHCVRPAGASEVSTPIGGRDAACSA